MFLVNPQLADFSALVVVLLLTHCYGGQSQVTGTSQQIVAMIGDDITLPCHLPTSVDATNMAVEWTRPGLTPRFVHLRRDGLEHQLEENPLYKGRTSLSPSQLKCGDVSLTLSKVKLSDAGSYECLVPKSGSGSVVKLIVGSVSSPVVEISKVSSGVLLVCKSAGWYPEPEVLWLDAEGKLLSAGPTETVRGPDDLYTVSSRVTVERHSSSFTCRVHQRDTNQTREAQITVPADLFMVHAGTAARISIFFTVWIMFVVVVGLVLWKLGLNKTKTTDSSIELQQLMGGEEGERLMTKRERSSYLDNAKAKLEEESQKNEGELKHVQDVIITLTEQKNNLKNQREKLISLQQEDKVLIEENKKELMEIGTFTSEKTKMKLERNRDDLKKRRSEHEELLKNTDTLLETTEEMIIRMTERKGKLERDKEKINQHLKEIERQRQREEIQKKLQSEPSDRDEEQLNRQVKETEGEDIQRGKSNKGVIQETREMINRMRERKEKLERDKEKISEDLKEVVSQREKTEREDTETVPLTTSEQSAGEVEVKEGETTEGQKENESIPERDRGTEKEGSEEVTERDEEQLNQPLKDREKTFREGSQTKK
ncbi:trichohyalin-like [Centropristis striata]|uniref:trichohyalin-like n=1 Tax=Centropristis striata TaxID=184440 RepID=UPI0027DFF1EB|nr:trichohyalin-like [Centropristis striata]